MKNFGNKIDNDETSAGVVVASEYNSAFNELKKAVEIYLRLNELDNQQLGKAIDIASKAMFYNDEGTPNAVHLTRGATNEKIETLFDGMLVFFSPANANTATSTLKVNGLTPKVMKFNNSALVAGTLVVGAKYIAVYKLSDDSFHIDAVATGLSPSEIVDKSYVFSEIRAVKSLIEASKDETKVLIEALETKAKLLIGISEDETKALIKNLDETKELIETSKNETKELIETLKNETKGELGELESKSLTLIHVSFNDALSKIETLKNETKSLIEASGYSETILFEGFTDLRSYTSIMLKESIVNFNSLSFLMNMYTPTNTVQAANVNINVSSFLRSGELRDYDFIFPIIDFDNGAMTALMIEFMPPTYDTVKMKARRNFQSARIVRITGIKG